MRGQKVLARAFQDAPKVLRLWEVVPGGYLLCGDAEFTELANGNIDILPVGFPAEDVFEYEPALVERIEGVLTGGGEPREVRQLWQQARPLMKVRQK